MSIIIHIGYPKTATTWLQKNFFPFISNAYYLSRHDTFTQLIRPNTMEYEPRLIRSEITSRLHGKEHLILSLENIVGTAHNFGLNGYLTAEHARRISEVFPEALILLFIRRQPNIIVSNYIQYIKGGGTWGINKYLYHNNFRNINGLTIFSFKYFEYDLIIKFYIKLFGEARVKVFLFEQFAENPLSFSEMLAKKLNLKINLSSLAYYKVNPGYRKAILTLAKFTNRFTEKKMLNKYYLIHIPFWFSYSQKVLKWLNHYRIFGSYPTVINVLGKKNMEKINEYYRKSNHVLLEQFNLKSIKKYGYPL